MKLMRDNTTMKHVRTNTTGHIEADMLGNYYYCRGDKSKQNMPRPHIEHMIERKQNKVLKWFQTFCISAYAVSSHGRIRKTHECTKVFKRCA